MNILILGSKGFLGQKFVKTFPHAKTSDIDIADSRAVSQACDLYTPDVIINAAGKTGHPNIDWCEEHKEETLRSNVLGPLVLLSECQKRSMYLVHISSGCIYEGDNGGKGFAEDDPPNFFGSYYSRTKIWAEDMVKEFPVLIVRLRMPFDCESHQRNLLNKLLTYKKVLDVQNSLTYLPDFLDATKILIEQKKTGVFNIVNEGTMSPYEAISLYKECVQPYHLFERLSLKDLSSVVKASRSNCILSTHKLKEEGITLPDVRERVTEALLSIHTSTMVENAGTLV